MFEHLKEKMHEILYDEWKYGKWFKIGLYDFLNQTKTTKNHNQSYYIFKGILDNGNPFRINTNLMVEIHIAKKSFDKEITKHVNFNCLPSNRLDLVLNICRKDKYFLLMKDIELKEHNRLGDDILGDVK